MSILTRLTAGATLKDPREGQGTTTDRTSIAEIGIAVGTLDWFAHDLIMQQHCEQTPPNLNKTIEQIGRIFLDQWRKGSGPQQINRKRLQAISRSIWQDFCTNQRMTDVERSMLCGMSERQFRRGTNEVYRATLAELNTIATNAYRKVKAELRSDN